MEEQVILVDEQDQEIGLMEKMQAHEEGVLHRAFSVMVFNEDNELLLQQRALEKYHTPGLWTNTCCSHPRDKESWDDAVHRKMQQEMGFDCPVEKVGTFIYKKTFDNSLIEHELDHVFIGRYNGAPVVNPEEVADWKWIGLDELYKTVQVQPQAFTFWFKEILDRFDWKSIVEKQ